MVESNVASETAASIVGLDPNSERMFLEQRVKAHSWKSMLRLEDGHQKHGGKGCGNLTDIRQADAIRQSRLV